MQFSSGASLVPSEAVRKASARLAAYRRHLDVVAKTERYVYAESSINLSEDENLLRTMNAMKRKKASVELKWIFVVGIGGSNLGTKAVYDAIFGTMSDLECSRTPHMIFVDTVDTHAMQKLSAFIHTQIRHPHEFLINVISKSGNTLETIANAELLFEMFEQGFEYKDRIVITTDAGSKLQMRASELKLDWLEIPKTAGGRFSVFSAVGLFPMMLAGIDVRALRDGANHAKKMCLESKEKDNVALQSAARIFYHWQKKMSILNSFFFHPELESLGKWYRQLVGETLGKETDLNGKMVHAGMMPIVSIGTTDLHSVGQLYFGGPKNIFTEFIWTGPIKPDVRVRRKGLLSVLAPEAAGKTAGEIKCAILTGVKKAYAKHKLPFIETQLDDLSTYSLGEYMQTKMIEVMYLAQLMNVNAFDQPGVEAYKIESRKILK